jgi:hypothetical protein
VAEDDTPKLIRERLSYLPIEPLGTAESEIEELYGVIEMTMWLDGLAEQAIVQRAMGTSRQWVVANLIDPQGQFNRFLELLPGRIYFAANEFDSHLEV